MYNSQARLLYSPQRRAPIQIKGSMDEWFNLEMRCPAVRESVFPLIFKNQGKNRLSCLSVY